MSHYVIGVKPSSGKYQGYDFDNLNLQCIVSDASNLVFGKAVEVVKMKASAVTSACNRQGIGLDDLEDATIRIYYNRYGKAEDFDVLGRPAKK